MNFRAVWTLTRVFFLELIREKLLLSALFVGFALFLLSQVLGSLSFDEKERIVFHLSVTSMQVVGVFLGLIYGSNALPYEVEKQTCLLVLSRPVSRLDFFVAKASSLLLLLFCFDVILSVLLYFILSKSYALSSFSMIVTGTFLEQSILLLLALAASLVLRRSVAVFFSVGIWLLGHWLPDLTFFAKKSENAVFEGLVKVLEYAIPHFYELNWRSHVLLTEGLSFDLFLRALAHSMGWLILLCWIGTQVWKRRDLV